MPVPVEKVLPGKCFKFPNSAPRRVLLLQDKKVTFILRDKSAWAVMRYHLDADSFARGATCEIDCATLQEITEESPS